MILLGCLISKLFLLFFYDFAKLSYFNVIFFDVFYDFTRRSYFNVVFKGVIEVVISWRLYCIYAVLKVYKMSLQSVK